MNGLLRRCTFFTAIVSVVMLFVLASCKDDPPVQQPPGIDTTMHEDTTSPAPTGMPNWNDQQYDWLVTRDSICGWRDISNDYWTPKFQFIVVDASPDGKNILLSLVDRVVIYDTSSHGIQPVFPFSCEYAAWSHDGRYIVGVSNYSALQQRFALYDRATDRWQFIPLPDTVETVNPVAVWMPGDTSLLVGLSFHQSGGYFSLQTRPPYEVKLSRFSLEDNFSQREIVVVSGADHPELRVAPIGDSLAWKSFGLPGVVQYGDTKMSPDGNWLAFRMDADVRGTRFNSHYKVTSLGIIDLRPGSPTQYQLYRVFPDYTYAYRNCSSLWFFSGMAWSEDGKYVYHEQVRIADSTTQIVRRDVRTGKVEAVSNFLTPP